MVKNENPSTRGNSYSGTKPQRVNVLGVGISVTNIPSAVANIEGWLKRGERCYVCVTGVHGVIESQKDECLRKIHNKSGLTIPDGMPMVWAGRIYGFSDIELVCGPDLMPEVCRMSVPRGYTHFLYGGNVGVAEKLKENLEKRFPGIQILGTYTPPFRPLNRDEEEELLEQVEKLKPDFFWVGLSTPKQERFMGEYISKLNTKVMFGVGAAFDIHAGLVKDAPRWIKDIGLGWFYRLCHNPRRLSRRYFYIVPLFIYKFSKQLLTGKC